ncbi:Uma2 family endonuclease [Synechocystis sp. LKSZ1]|uniref:Uma2 family endonuclease n=1 Tax=Synechocystis sp. LKSZ1 TaxID=3144951 RepID=UPI00336BB469
MTVALERDILYPDSDGQPMADNTKQFRWIVLLKENLECLFADDPDVFVAGDLLWYPVEGHPEIRIAPDAMVVLGRPKGDRGSYRQWLEDNQPPQVVFEVLSPGNTTKEMTRKLKFYEHYKVEEYYIYDPDYNELTGLERVEGELRLIEAVENWTSPRLSIRFELTETELKVYYPDGRPFLSTIELARQAEAAQQRADQAQQEMILERQRAEQADQQAELAQQRAEQAELENARLRELLRQAGWSSGESAPN